MHPDELLARQLQAAELAHQGVSRFLTSARAQLEDAAAKGLSYEDELSQALAQSLMPLEELEEGARGDVELSELLEERDVLDYDTALLKRLLKWFKSDFFTWVHTVPCSKCSSPTHPAGLLPPTPEELEHGAQQVESYACSRCASVSRFPRFNSATKLLETRRGRCGEWANAFALCARAAGFCVRLAVDCADHVWVEAWLSTPRRWVHVDPCEGCMDEPLVYERGWGKKLAVVLAAGAGGGLDVTERYVATMKDARPRRAALMPEREWLALEACIAQLNAKLWTALDPTSQATTIDRHEADVEALARGPSGRPALAAALRGRQSGSAAWVAARGEDGQGAGRGEAAESTGEAEAASPMGRYRRAETASVRIGGPAARGHSGWAVRASGENEPNETADKLFDSSGSTKWLDFGGAKGNAWVELRQLPGSENLILEAYSLTCANDAPERDPRHVRIEGWTEETQRWTLIDEKKDLVFEKRHQTLRFEVAPLAPATPHQRFRLVICSLCNVPHPANSVQLQGWDLWLA